MASGETGAVKMYRIWEEVENVALIENERSCLAFTAYENQINEPF